MLVKCVCVVAVFCKSPDCVMRLPMCFLLYHPPAGQMPGIRWVHCGRIILGFGICVYCMIIGAAIQRGI